MLVIALIFGAIMFAALCVSVRDMARANRKQQIKSAAWNLFLNNLISGRGQRPVSAAGNANRSSCCDMIKPAR